MLASASILRYLSSRRTVHTTQRWRVPGQITLKSTPARQAVLHLPPKQPQFTVKAVAPVVHTGQGSVKLVLDHVDLTKGGLERAVRLYSGRKGMGLYISTFKMMSLDEATVQAGRRVHFSFKGPAFSAEGSLEVAPAAKSGSSVSAGGNGLKGVTKTTTPVKFTGDRKPPAESLSWEDMCDIFDNHGGNLVM